MAKQPVAVPALAQDAHDDNNSNQCEHERAEQVAVVWDETCDVTTIEETIQFGLEKEAKSRYVRDCDYMKETQWHGMKLAWRQKICQWMFETGKAFALSVDTVGCAVQYMDQFLCVESVDKIMMLSLVCIFSASKVHDSDPVTLDELNLLCDSRFTREDIRKVEVHLLRALNWELNPPNYFTFARDFINALPSSDASEDTLDSVLELLRLVAEGENLLFMRTSSASSVALAAVQLVVAPQLDSSRLPGFSSLSLGESLPHEYLAAHNLVERVYTANFVQDDFAKSPRKEDLSNASSRVASSPVAVENHPYNSAIVGDIEKLKKLINGNTIAAEDAHQTKQQKSSIRTKKRHRTAILISIARFSNLKKYALIMEMGGAWQREFERNWRSFTTRALSERFGAQYEAQLVTQDDKAYLATLLRSLGVQHHAPPKQPSRLPSRRNVRGTHRGQTIDLQSLPETEALPKTEPFLETEPFPETEPLEDMGDDEESSCFDAVFNASTMSHASYVYRTPQKQKRMSSGQYFPEFTSQDFMAEDDNAGRESVSQNLRNRMAGVSPIARFGHKALHKRQDSNKDSKANGSLLADQYGQFPDVAPAPTPPTGSPSPSSESSNTFMSAAAILSDDEFFLTPRPIQKYQPQQNDSAVAIQERLQSREKSAHESQVHDLDVSMHSMNVSDDGFMVLDNPHEEEHAAAENNDTHGAVSRGRGNEEREQEGVPKVLCFSSGSEDEEMDYEFGDGSPYESPAEDMEQDGGAFSDEQPAIMAEVGTENTAQVVQPDAAREKPPAEAAAMGIENNANSMNSSRQSIDSFDAAQAAKPSKPHGPFFRTKLPLEIEYRYAIDRRRKKQRRKSYTLKTIGPYRAPEFRIELASYQQEAVAWMLAREQFPKKHPEQAQPNSKPNRYVRVTDKVCGGILADEMGLGKTVCCIALICESLKQIREECQRETESSGNNIPRIKPPTLIITPLSILSQWENEIRQKTNLSVITYHGSTRKTYRTSMDFIGADIVLSTYDTLRLKECKVGPSTITSDEEDGSDGQATGSHSEWKTILRNTDEDKRFFVGSKLHQLSWFRIILDESHLITNASCARARASYSLQSKRRWCVTGTPIQNSSSDVASLISFVGIKNRTEAELNEILPHVMLRRLKTTVDSESNEPILALPEKTEEEIELRFANELEQAFYMLLHRSTKTQVLQYLQARDAQPQFMHVFELLLRLRQTCNSFALVTKDPLTEVRERGTLLLTEAGATSTRVSTANMDLLQRVEAQFANANQHTFPQSTKLCALLDQLRAVKARNEKALVISQWTGFLDLIAESLENHNVGGNPVISFGKLDGRMAAKEREQVIAWFQHDKRLDVLLISLRTGGLGLNLTSASHVFIMEPSWNPSIESQAIDRAHRFGQSQPVRVVRFIMKNTIEERVVELQRKKRELAATLLGDSSAPNSSSPAFVEEPRLTRAELRQLFTQEFSEEW